MTRFFAGIGSGLIVLGLATGCAVGQDGQGTGGVGGPPAGAHDAGQPPTGGSDAGGPSNTADAGGPSNTADAGSPSNTADAGSGVDASPSPAPTACTANRTSTCGGTSFVACAPGDRCGNLYQGSGARNWPSGTDATGPVDGSGATTCTDSNGVHYPATGVGSATWYGFIDCGSYKIYPVDAGCSFDVLTYNDCCSGCYLNDVNVDVQEMINGVWTTMMHISHPYNGSCQHWDDVYVPQTSQVRLNYGGYAGFYVCVYEE